MLLAEIMDMSFAVQALSAKHIVENDLPVGVTKALDEIDYICCTNESVCN